MNSRVDSLPLVYRCVSHGSESGPDPSEYDITFCGAGMALLACCTSSSSLDNSVWDGLAGCPPSQPLSSSKSVLCTFCISSYSNHARGLSPCYCRVSMSLCGFIIWGKYDSDSAGKHSMDLIIVDWRTRVQHQMLNVICGTQFVNQF